MKKLIKNNYIKFISIIFIFFLFLLYNYKLVLNLSTALTDWLDYPLIVYILEHNIKHISQLDFTNLGNIRSLYPSPGGMYFTDILLVQGVIGTIIYPFTQDYILTHNLIFLLTGLTNIISLHYFWEKIFKRKSVVILLSLLFTFSPYYFSQYVHYQMLPYSFFFFSAGLLISSASYKNIFISGLLTGLQFLAGVYLGFYSLTFTGLYFLYNLAKKRDLFSFFKKSFVYLASFLILAGYFVYQYVHIKTVYQIERSDGEYIDLAMQVSDLLFNPFPSLWVEVFYKNINLYNHRVGGEQFGTGFIFLFVTLAGMWLSLKKIKKKNILFFYLLFFFSGIAALGPRLTINGKYFGTPLPYYLLLKFTPIFDSLRRTGAWYFIVQISMLYFVGILLSWAIRKYSFKKILPITLMLLSLYAFEMVPIKQRTSVEEYKSYSYQPLIENCKEDEVLLELPFSPMQPKTPITVTLSYWTKMLLNQTLHDCLLVNGYSGYDPTHYKEFREQLESDILVGTKEDIVKTLATKQVTYIKVNKRFTYELPETLFNLLESNQYQILLDDDQFLVVSKN